MELINQLKKRLTQNLPAEIAHARLMNYKRKSAVEILNENQYVKKSAVLCLLYKDNEEWMTYLMVRNTYDGVHSGQVSLPGGRKEEFDVDFKATALRESHEELNINPGHVEILGGLSPLYIPPSNFLVYPYLGFSTSPQNIVPDTREVNEVITAKLSDFLSPDSISTSKIPVGKDRLLMNVNHYTVNGHIVWGATGMIMAELAYILEEMGF